MVNTNFFGAEQALMKKKKHKEDKKGEGEGFVLPV